MHERGLRQRPEDGYPTKTKDGPVVLARAQLAHIVAWEQHMHSGYEIEVDRVDKDGWEAVMGSFDDASLYQTWSWGAVRRGARNLSHLILRKNGRVLAAAQVWIMRVPFLDRGIAYVKRGPLWLNESGGVDPDVFREMIRALRDEYACRRGLLLRIMPNAAGVSPEFLHNTLTVEGFRTSTNQTGYRTFLIDLSADIEELRMGLKKKWRQNLTRAQKQGLTVEVGHSHELFDAAIDLYGRMRERKRFAEHMNVIDIREAHRTLPERMKMTIMLCRYNNRPVTAYVTSQVGGTAIDIISATVSDGLVVNSSYLVHWQMLERLKSSGCRWYDLGGIEPVNFPGPYSFKAGLAGKSGTDLTFSQFDFCIGNSSELAAKAADSLTHAYRTMKELAVKFT